MADELLHIFTIGHSTHPIEEFLDLLRNHQIQVVADVRRFPGSRRHPQFGQENLSSALRQNGIDYVHFPELGGRRKARPDSQNTAWRVEAFRGYADYMQTDEFNNGMKRLLDIAHAKRTCIMCAEALWWQCHRGLIADWLKAKGHEVIHMLANGKTEEHPFTSAASLSNGELSYQGSNKK